MMFTALLRRWGPPLAALALVVAAAGTVYGYRHWRDHRDDGCLIVMVSGAKLCGDDARAWCDATDRARRGNPAAGDGQRVCDRLRDG